MLSGWNCSRKYCRTLLTSVRFSNPAYLVSTRIVSAMTAAATPLKLEVEVFKVHGPSDFVGAFEVVANSCVS